MLQFNKLFVIAGPCVIEGEEMIMEIAGSLKEITDSLSLPLIFKSSFDKANRSVYSGFRGPGLDEGLRILSAVKEKYHLPILTDIHLPLQAPKVATVADLLQIPAFLCRQTDLLIAAVETGKGLNLKKGQFVAPADMKGVLSKILAIDKQAVVKNRVLLTERGSSFGYNNLVVDMRSIKIMGELGCPVVFDATHSVQLPSAQGYQSGGEREFVEPLALAAVAAGAQGLFLEVHQNPPQAKCDSASMIDLATFESLLKKCLGIYELLEKFPSKN